jgi:hypothetical protein
MPYTCDIKIDLQAELRSARKYDTFLVLGHFYGDHKNLAASTVNGSSLPNAGGIRDKPLSKLQIDSDHDKYFIRSFPSSFARFPRWL